MTDWTDILDHWPVLLLGALVVVPFLYVAYCDWSYSRATRRSRLVHDLSGPEAKALILGLADIIVGTQPDEWAADKLLALRWARPGRAGAHPRRPGDCRPAEGWVEMSAIGNEGAAVGTDVNSADRLSVPRRAIRENPKSTKERSVRGGPVHVSVAIAEALERISKS